MNTISSPTASSSFSRSISSSSASSAEEVKPDDDSPVLDRWDRRLVGAFTVCMAIEVVALALFCCSFWIKNFGVSTNLLAYVAFGGMSGALLLFCVMLCKGT